MMAATRTLKVLIIDDNPDDRDTYVRLLKKNANVNYQCPEASDSKRGMEMLHDTQPDCVLLDYSLPGANGIDVLRQIRAGAYAVPIIMLTGQGNEKIAVQAMKLGANDYLSKTSMTSESLDHSIHMAIEHNYLQAKIDEQTQLLFKKEMRYQQLIEGVHDYAFCWLNVEGCVDIWNSGAEKLMGYTEADVLKKPMSLFYVDEDCRKGVVEQSMRQALETGKYAGECGHRRKDGSLFWASVQIDALRDPGGHPIGFVKITRDITERRHAEMERQHLIDRLMQSNMDLERFAYVASHDMQEPVRMVVNFSTILSKDYADVLDENGKDYLTFISESASRIHTMIDDLLDYARLGSENNGMVRVDGAAELGHVLKNLEAMVTETNAKITYDLLPEFQGNPVQFMRLMQNLILNAMKYRSPQRAPVIHVGVEDHGAMWRFSVTDNGMGVDESFTQKIFEPFRRLHSWEKIKGTGLGLSVCKKIAENHGGTIGITSVSGQGSTFYVTLPKLFFETHMVA